MSDLLLPTSFTRVTALQRAVPVTGRPDLTDPTTGRIVIPALVEIHLRCDEGVPGGTHEYASVSVTGPRRLKSGRAGHQITSLGWQHAHGDHYRPGAVRPDWLAQVLVELLPEDWNPALLDLPVGGDR